MSIQRNLELYPWYQAACWFLTWMPIFFLFFSEQMGLKDLLLLESIYYFAVVLIEVPSGYFSDVIGRKKTLIISSLFFCAACVLFIIGGNFWVLVAAQIGFAAFMAFQSGTNTVFHYESLKAVGLEKEYGDREAAVGRLSMMSGAVAALFGGFLGAYNLKWPFAAALLVGAIGLFMAISFSEPPEEENEEKAGNFLKQLVSVFTFLKDKLIAWLFAYYVLFYALSHIPYEFYQPYLKLLEETNSLPGSAPLTSGIIYAATFFIGAFVSGKSMWLKRKLGLRKLFVISLILMLMVIGVMGTFLSMSMMLIMLFRNSPWSAIKAPFNEIVTPKIAPNQRATFHSLLSLAGRLTFFATLFGLSFFVQKEQLTDWPTLSMLLKICLLASCIIGVPLLFMIPKKLNQKP